MATGFTQPVRYGLVRIELDGRPLTVVVVDVRSNPLMSRREPLAALDRLLAEQPDGPMLVVGDFNTPSDSVHLEALRRNYANAFETAGNGWSATWPVPLPVMALDQIWANRHVRVHQCRQFWSWSSDHRPIAAEIEF